MKTYTRIIKYAEIVLVIFVWGVLIATPILFREDYVNPVSRSIMNQLEILVPLSVVFLINRFVFVPYLLFKGKWVLFMFMVFGLIIVLTIGSALYDSKVRRPGPPVRAASEGSDLRMPRQARNPERERPRPEGEPPQQRQPRPMPPFANFLIFSFLIVGFDTGLRSGLRWIEAENEKVRLEKENVANQLILLRNQVSPHFFMNTLNNIHSLIDVDRDEAKEAVIKLSKMMRYLLYETESGRTTIKKEVEFIESYVNLMKLRYNEKVKITLDLPGDIPDKPVPPLLFTSLIENAFKHGISYREESFINIDLAFGNDRMLLVVKNSKTHDSKKDEFSGIGIGNTKKRLDLLYGSEYHLDILDTKDQFIVNLSIPV
jgi:hypothetical protein